MPIPITRLTKAPYSGTEKSSLESFLKSHYDQHNTQIKQQKHYLKMNEYSVPQVPGNKINSAQY